eukprot:gnl/MRDRNA2_/MRDRNA2_30794_c0_seq1.p2 gnl/MRDRNA2_/MRDRNA2_30794_c0~~gnl/MRDRNA2_/MRDRNA2_30794_c0_seq1.p2  ORF type:complete len:111 (+),score=9.36 gnl/MRDRNA2_/MRDRNA2_30794_c0_seq1:518-850(+)
MLPGPTAISLRGHVIKKTQAQQGADQTNRPVPKGGGKRSRSISPPRTQARSVKFLSPGNSFTRSRDTLHELESPVLEVTNQSNKHSQFSTGRRSSSADKQQSSSLDSRQQ